MQLRPYQSSLVTGINNYWSTHPRGKVLAVLATGGGKTVIFSSIIAAEQGATCAIAHRQELVSQMSLTLAKNGIYHRIVGSNKTVKNCVKIHMDELGKTFYDAGSKHAVASVDTIIRRGEQLANWLPSVRLWVIDEAHHVLKDNKWGKAVQMFPNARGLGVTATPCRADGNGLGSHADGVFDTMFEGVAMGELIRDGYLTDYKIFAPPSSFSREQIKVSDSTGDFNLNQMREVVNGSSLVAHDEKTITGDVVAQYLKIARGKSGVTFTVDVASAEEIAEQYNKAGVPAAAISCNTPDLERFAAVRKFKNKEILQLVNSEILTEGFDCPGIEVVSFGRPTESYSMYSQMFGEPDGRRQRRRHIVKCLDVPSDRYQVKPTRLLLTTWATSCATVYRTHRVSGVLTAGSVAQVKVNHRRCACVQLARRCTNGSVMHVLTVVSLYQNLRNVVVQSSLTVTCASLTRMYWHRCVMRLWEHVRHPRQCVTG